MGGVWSWAEHIQAIHSQRAILQQSTKLLRQIEKKKKLPIDEILADEHQCLQDERVDFSSRRMRAFVWDFKGSHRVPYVPNGVPPEAHPMASTQAS